MQVQSMYQCIHIATTLVHVLTLYKKLSYRAYYMAIGKTHEFIKSF